MHCPSFAIYTPSLSGLSCRLLSSAAIVGLSLLLIAATAAAAKPCLTKEQARKLWPNEWLYWHTERHCWDRIKGTSGTYDERQPEPPPKGYTRDEIIGQHFSRFYTDF